jgi:hypothetical protein
VVSARVWGLGSGVWVWCGVNLGDGGLAWGEGAARGSRGRFSGSRPSKLGRGTLILVRMGHPPGYLIVRNLVTNPMGPAP